jgi:Lrp/AsnC family transcriptional regulator for asnA, asnC and gidA
MYRDVVAELENIKEVVECHFTTGPYSMLIKVYAKDNLDLMKLLNDRIQHIPGVTETETLISLEQSMNRQIDVEQIRSKK